ncbi:MAG: chemotaxis protein CheW [Rhodanobacteraceae bacterium]
MMDRPREIRGVMIPVTGGRLLLPNASIAEVITFSTPEVVDGAPDWLLGRLPWRGWRLPLFSFSILSGLTTFEVYNNARVVVLKAFGGRPQRPYLALLAQGFPRLTTITPDVLAATEDSDENMPGVKSVVTTNDDSAVVPDLAAIEAMIDEALSVSQAPAPPE